MAEIFRQGYHDFVTNCILLSNTYATLKAQMMLNKGSIVKWLTNLPLIQRKVNPVPLFVQRQVKKHLSMINFTCIYMQWTKKEIFTSYITETSV